MSMEQHITPVRIANAIMQDSSFNGVHILVEGIKDLRAYHRLINPANAKVQITFGKYKLREVYSILTERGFSRKLGIRDADFLRITNNSKFSSSYDQDIYPTDGHDTEIMMLMAGILPDLFTVTSSKDRVNAFELTHKDIQLLIFELLYPLGCLKLANKRHNLGLIFKPETPEGNRLKINKFICEKTWSFLGNEKMINTVYEYSRNRSSEIASRDTILEHLVPIIDENHSLIEVVNDHDAANVLFMILKHGLRSSSKTLQTPDCVEELMVSHFDIRKFSKTRLYNQIKEWQTQKSLDLLIE